MKRIKEYFKGKACKFDIGADGNIVWAVGRITGEIEGTIKKINVYNTPSAVYWTTPHGSTFEAPFNQLYELEKEEKELLIKYEKDAFKEVEKKMGEGTGLLFYGNRLNDVSYDAMKLD